MVDDKRFFFSKGYEIDMLIYYFSILYSANVYNFVGYNILVTVSENN